MYINLMKNSLNLMKKQERKLGDLINEKSLKLNKKIKKKLIIYCFIKDEKLPKFD